MDNKMDEVCVNTIRTLANVEDMTIPRCVADADAAIALIREHHKTWLVAQKT